MGSTRPSMQELIGRRRRAGFVGRAEERAAFRRNLDLAPEDERHRFLFHVHGDAGVGKTRLVRELEQIAREAGALTVYVDEGVAGVPEALGVMARQFAAQGRRFKELERLLAAHRERRHEAEAALAVGGPEDREGPSAGSLAVARAAQVGLGMVPVAGAFAVALDTDRLAQGADRLRARFRSQEDAQLVLSPERVLTPVLLNELAGAADTAPWIVLLLDTYERTGPFLDPWLHDVMTTDRYGALPANVVVVTSGQHPFDTARWGSFADFRTDLPLGPFTEAEARGLLADKGVRDEPVVAEVLRLTGGLPVLVTALAEQHPTDPDDVGDPSATAVERFLKWEPDPARRSVALACALPRRLDLDVFRTAVDCPDEDADALFDWLRGLPFVTERPDRLTYHDLVRDAMLRLRRRHSPRGWTREHERLAEAYGGWREEAANGLRPGTEWDHEPWRELLLEETYHRLCARPQTALPGALNTLLPACAADPAVGRRWAAMVAEAGITADTPAVRDWGRRLGQALTDGVTEAMDLLLARPDLDSAGRALAHVVRGRELRNAGDFGRSLAEYDRAIELDPERPMAHYGRGLCRRALDDFDGALADLDRADQLAPDTALFLAARGETHRLAGRFTEALADLDRAVALEPADASTLASRGVCRHALEQYDAALADFDRALSLNPGHLWARVRRSRLRGVRGEWAEAFADLDETARRAPDSPWIASERGDAYRRAGRFADAVTELTRAAGLLPDYPSALAGRGAALHELGRSEEALTDLDRAIELDPDFEWAMETRARIRLRLGEGDQRLPGGSIT
ncbi:tetratricopeptide repeat protein [Streptomyces sasae]|uniref:tetratricopeptide repeat protein n=1 Tax=Streptomyces sasae TaxID=1266772 RepID=UPI002930AC48|nr:tetratricopeptide repeat protein [Streptomyces sasae]